MDVNEFAICLGDGMVSGVASAEEFLSWPRTPKEMTVPIRMPTAKVSRTTRVEAQRCAFSLAEKALTREFICLLFLRLMSHCFFARGKGLQNQKLYALRVIRRGSTGFCHRKISAGSGGSAPTSRVNSAFSP